MNVSVMSPSVHFCYDGLNGSCIQTTYPLALRIPLYFLFTSTVIVTVGGNLLVMMTIVLCVQIQTPTNFFVFSMAVADLLLGLTVMPPSMIESMEKCWYFGDFLCKFHACIDITLCNASVLHLMCISIDRFYAVSQPLRYQNKMSTRVVLTMISVCWLFSATFGFAVVFFPSGDSEHHVESISQKCIGECSALHDKEVGASYFFVFYFIPLTVMSSIYLRIFVIAIRHANIIQGVNKQVRTSKHASKIDYKATATLGIIIGVFVCCWTPFFLCNIVDPVVNHSIPEPLYEILMWIAYLNSMFNPLIYAFFQTWFRKQFLTLLKSLF